MLEIEKTNFQNVGRELKVNIYKLLVLLLTEEENVLIINSKVDI